MFDGIVQHEFENGQCLIDRCRSQWNGLTLFAAPSACRDLLQQIGLDFPPADGSEPHLPKPRQQMSLQRIFIGFQGLRLHAAGNPLQPIPGELSKPHSPRDRDMVAPERSLRLPLQEDLFCVSAVLLARPDGSPDASAVCGDVVDEPDALASPEPRSDSPHLTFPPESQRAGALPSPPSEG